MRNVGLTVRNVGSPVVPVGERAAGLPRELRRATCYDRGTTGTPLPLVLWFDRQAASVLVVLHLARMLICLRFLDHAEED